MSVAFSDETWRRSGGNNCECVITHGNLQEYSSTYSQSRAIDLLLIKKFNYGQNTSVNKEQFS